MNSMKPWVALALVLLSVPLLLFFRNDARPALPEPANRSEQEPEQVPVVLEGLAGPEEERVLEERESLASSPAVNPSAGSSPDVATEALESLRVRVSFADGQPAAGGVVLLSSDTEILTWEDLDEGGVASIDRHPEGLRVYAFGYTPSLVFGQVVDGEDEVVIVLPELHEFSGRILVDGAPPAEPLDLIVTQSGTGTRLSGFPPLPAEIRQRFFEKGPSSFALRVGPSALFRTTGWAEGERIRLQAPPGYSFEGRRWKLETLEGPETGVELRLLREAMLHGTVIEAESGEPLADIRVQLGPKGISPNTAQTEADGSFTIEIPKQSVRKEGESYLVPVDEAVLELRTRNKSRALKQTVRFDPNLGGDLGVFSMEAAGELALEIVDENGEPIPKASVAHAGVTRPRKANSRGRLKLRGLAAEELRLDVFAAGYETKGLVLSSLPQERLTVSLVPCAKIEMTVRCEGGEVPENCIVECVTADALIAPEVSSVLSLSAGSYKHRRLSLVGMSQADRPIPTGEGWTERFKTRSAETVCLPHVHPGQDIAIRLIDSSGYSIWPKDGTPHHLRLGPGEWRDLEADVSCVTSEMRGRVEDTDGLPLEGVRVRFAVSKPRAVLPGERERIQLGSVRTNDQGEFSISNLSATHLDLSVSEDGYGHRVLQAVSVDSEPTLVLQAGREVSVTARDPEGAPVPVSSATAYLEAFRVGRSRPGEAGVTLCDELPLEPLAIEAWVGGRRFRQEIDADSKAVVFEVPASGVLQVSWSIERPL
ncbi:MAG: carboxypeptidase regulatory-like domain-containing protein, partial [Planctomycetota bacterium]